jgi:riboflavin synthase
MFTGIIEATGSIDSFHANGRLRIAVGKLDMSDVALGDSIAVNGVCLTVVEFSKNHFVADVSNETRSRTTLGQLKKSDEVNLEKALTPTTRLGGHLVSGHVDGVGEVISRTQDVTCEKFIMKVPDTLAKYIAEKGSICVDGTSLTVNGVSGNQFELTIVPHTLQETIMHHYEVGTLVNIEVDIIARYLERLLLGEKAAQPNQSISMGFLAEHGFMKS